MPLHPLQCSLCAYEGWVTPRRPAAIGSSTSYGLKSPQSRESPLVPLYHRAEIDFPSFFDRLDDVQWRFYILYILLNVVSSLCVFFFFPETTGKSLEEIDAGMFLAHLIIRRCSLTLTIFLTVFGDQQVVPALGQIAPAEYVHGGERDPEKTPYSGDAKEYDRELSHEEIAKA